LKEKIVSSSFSYVGIITYGDFTKNSEELEEENPIAFLKQLPVQGKWREDLN